MLPPTACLQERWPNDAPGHWNNRRPPITDLTRRSFLTLALTTVSAAALSNPALAALIPEEVRSRPIAPAYPLAIDESGYLFDPSFDHVLPTYRQMLDIAHLSEEEQEQALLEHLGYELGDEDDVYSMPDLDDLVEPESVSQYWLAENSEWRSGIDLYASLDEATLARLGLVLVEGDQPGSSFTCVKCLDPRSFQQQLLREGINVEITV